MYPKIHCCVFEESGDPERHKSHVDDLDTHNAVFLDQLKRVAFADGMNIHYSHISHPPIHANDEEMEAAVNASRFDADYVINMYPRLNDIGPELGHQILS
ncbi:hypothetical protein KKC44_06215, partial [Patescibacteria group bacterium]|nr:hypothetical protein [Patescibacteria group bacterium]